VHIGRRNAQAQVCEWVMGVERLTRSGSRQIAARDAHLQQRKCVLKIGGGDRTCEIVPLGGIALRLLHKAELLGGLHAFGNHGNIQSMGHGDDHAGHGLAVLVGDAVLDERAIDLEAVQTEPGNVG
jgi:hypothetical protein